MTLSAYHEVAAEVKLLALVIRGEVFHDGFDVVVSGKYNGVPAVRLSNAENTPGVNVRMPAATSSSIPWRNSAHRSETILNALN